MFWGTRTGLCALLCWLQFRPFFCFSSVLFQHKHLDSYFTLPSTEYHRLHHHHHHHGRFKNENNLVKGQICLLDYVCIQWRETKATAVFLQYRFQFWNIKIIFWIKETTSLFYFVFALIKTNNYFVLLLLLLLLMIFFIPKST